MSSETGSLVFASHFTHYSGPAEHMGTIEICPHLLFTDTDYSHQIVLSPT